MESADAESRGPAGRDVAGPAPEDRPTSILEQTREELEERVSAAGFPRFHARQVLEWIHERLVPTYREMTDIPTPLRERLQRDGEILTGEVVRRDRASDRTEKLLVRLRDGQAVECVLIPEGDRRTACISTQVGCAVRCVFCASGLEGVQRNLSAAEIVEQLIHLKRTLKDGERISNLVFMGMGEPLHNVTNLLRSIEVLRAPWGANLGARRITVSTSGPPGRIPMLTQAGIPVHLAVSLHAPDDAVRRRMIPGKTSSVAELIAQSKAYFEKTGRRVTFEVALVDGLNSAPALARSLARMLAGFPCLVNLIPMNPVEGIPLRPPPLAVIDTYRRELESRTVQVAVRKRKGDRIAAACGQLRMRVGEERRATEGSPGA